MVDPLTGGDGAAAAAQPPTEIKTSDASRHKHKKSAPEAERSMKK